MRKHHFLFLLFAFLFLSGQALAQGPTIFVSTFGGQQILSVDGTTGATTVIHTGLLGFLPEDIVVGPDGNIYICDAASIIWRLSPDGLQIEKIYDKMSFTSGPAGPEGPSFLNDDLFFNTRGNGTLAHTGVWKIPGVAAIPFDPPATGSLNSNIPPPVNLIDATGTGSTFGEGTAFDRLGNLLIVDRSGSRILRVSAPSFAAPATVLIENPIAPAAPVLDFPFGIAVNSTGDIFVANGGSTLRNINRFDSSGAFVATFVNFSSPDSPFFLEFDASDNLFVATGARVLKVNTSGVVTPLVDLGVKGIAGTAVGLAVPATETSETLEFTDIQKENTYDFGSHKFKLFLDVNVGKVFKVKITAKDVRPKDLKLRLDPNVFPPGSDCVRFPGKGGKCVVYLAEGNSSDLPIPGDDFTGDIDILIKYFDDPLSPTVNPRMAHAFDEIPPADPPADFTEDMTTAFFPSLNPDTDPALSGRTTRWSEFVAVDQAITDPADFSGFMEPLGAGGKVFKSGRTIPVRFKLTDSEGNPVTDAVAHISVAKISNGTDGPVASDVEASGEANTDNLFRFDGGNYTYNLSTKGFTPGTYGLTVISTGFFLQTVTFVMK